MSETVPVLIDEVENKMRNAGIIIQNQAQIEAIIETPLVEAVSLFLAKNILTIATSANRYDAMTDSSRHGYIFLDNPSLSIGNELTLAEIGSGCRWENGYSWPSYLPLHLNPDMTIEEVEKIALGFASVFDKQEAWRAIPLTYPEAQQKLKGIDPGCGDHPNLYWHPLAIRTGMRVRPDVADENAAFCVVPDSVDE